MVDLGLKRCQSSIHFIHAIPTNHDVESGVALVGAQIGLNVRVLAKPAGGSHEDGADDQQGDDDEESYHALIPPRTRARRRSVDPSEFMFRRLTPVMGSCKFNIDSCMFNNSWANRQHAPSTSRSTMTSLSDATGTWEIDPAHTILGFSARHAMVAKVRGTFNEFSGSFTIDGANPTNSKADLTIQAGSIDTGQADRDGHLKSGDFLDAEQFPALTFTSTSIAVSGDSIKVTGDLTIHGVTKPVTIDYEFTGISQDPWGNTKIGFEGHAKINRKEFGLVWNAALETGGVLVGEDIKLELDVEATKKA